VRPIAELNFGRAPHYEIQRRSLVETYVQMFGNSGNFRTPGTREQAPASEAKFK
jgi:hypothetical protein